MGEALHGVCADRGRGLRGELQNAPRFSYHGQRLDVKLTLQAGGMRNLLSPLCPLSTEHKPML